MIELTTHGFRAQVSGHLDASVQHLELLTATPRQTEPHDALVICRSAVAPVRRLPVELLVEVFILCLPDGKYIIPRPTSAPLLLTQVCSSWRDIALSVPALWSSIQIDMDSTLSPRHVTTLASRVAAWLARSAQHHLSIRLFIEDHLEESLRTVFSQEAIDIVRILFRHVSQWQHIHWYIETPEVLAPARPYTAAVGDTALHSLYISVLENMSNDLTMLLNTIMAYSPQLRYYSYSKDNYAPEFGEGILEPPWASLTHVDLGCFEFVDELLRVFQDAHSLVQCRLDLEIMLEEPYLEDSLLEIYDPLEAIISNQSLEVLQVQTGTGLHGFINRLALPNLRELAFDFDSAFLNLNENQRWPEWSQSPFSDFISQSNCLLERLTFQNMRLAEDDLLACLELTSSSLQFLSVTDAGIDTVKDAVLRRLYYTTTPNDTVSYLCPRLETLIMRNCCRCSDGAFAAMVESRWKVKDKPTNGTTGQCARIKHVDVDGYFSPEDKLRLQTLVAEGLDAVFPHL